MIETFTISPLINGKPLVLAVQKTEITPTTETYRIEERGHILILQNNRRLFRGKGLRHRKGWWKVLEGEFKHGPAKEAITEAIERADPE